jgi:hypothetical protein
MRRILWTTFGAALIVAGITAAWTQSQTWRGGRCSFWFHHGPIGYVAHELDLSGTQKSQIKSRLERRAPEHFGTSARVRLRAERDGYTSIPGRTRRRQDPGHRHARGCDARKAVRGEGKAHGQDLLSGSEPRTTDESG